MLCFSIVGEYGWKFNGVCASSSIVGGAYFTRRWNSLAVSGEMGVHVAVSHENGGAATVAATPVIGANDGGGCMFSGLDLGLDSVDMNTHSLEEQNDDDHDDFDDEINDSHSSPHHSIPTTVATRRTKHPMHFHPRSCLECRLHRLVLGEPEPLEHRLLLRSTTDCFRLSGRNVVWRGNAE